MKHILFTLQNNTPLIITPDITTHMDGHPVLSFKYHIFLDEAINKPEQYRDKENNISDRAGDPAYYGYIIFEKPGQLFSYHEGRRTLTRLQVEEVIEYISHVRDHPGLWKTENL